MYFFLRDRGSCSSTLNSHCPGNTVVLGNFCIFCNFMEDHQMGANLKSNLETKFPASCSIPVA